MNKEKKIKAQKNNIIHVINKDVLKTLKKYLSKPLFAANAKIKANSRMVIIIPTILNIVNLSFLLFY